MSHLIPGFQFTNQRLFEVTSNTFSIGGVKSSLNEGNVLLESLLSDIPL